MSRSGALGVLAAYFLLRRWWRVLRSSLRCFFFAMRLRRFLMTEPTETSLSQWLGVVGDGHPGTGTENALDQFSKGRTTRSARLDRRRAEGIDATSADVGDGTLQCVCDRGLGYAVAASESDRRKLTGVNQPVDGHLGHAHELCDLGDRQESDFRNIGHPTYPFLLMPNSMA